MNQRQSSVSYFVSATSTLHYITFPRNSSCP